MNGVMKENDNFRLFSPDETYSNKLDKVFETTKRQFQMPLKEWDDDLAKEGKVIEMLSEHTLQGMAQGYVLTGRHAVFTSYEAFIQIVSSMADQYAKFLKQAKEVNWRGQIPSLTYVLSSSGWRQDHNGFSHQNPGFIDNMLQRQGDFINIYLPSDGSSALAVFDKCMKSSYGINVVIVGKQSEPRWINVDQAQEQLEDGIGIWKFASDEDPDIVFAGAGDYVSKEALAGLELFKREFPDVKCRFVNVMTMSPSGFGSAGNTISRKEFDNYFTEDKPVIFNYHGYPQTIKQILFDYCEDPTRFDVNGYIENGSTTTPFDMQVRNKISRFHVVMDACRKLSESGKITKEKADEVIKKYEEKLEDHVKYIREYGVDMEEIANWKWNN